MPASLPQACLHGQSLPVDVAAVEHQEALTRRGQRVLLLPAAEEAQHDPLRSALHIPPVDLGLSAGMAWSYTNYGRHLVEGNLPAFE